MSDRWAPIRRQAAAAQAEVRPAVDGEGRALVEHAIVDRGLVVLDQPHDDPMLHGCRAVANPGGGYVAFDGSLVAQQVTFTLAHELGHLSLGHIDDVGADGALQCSGADIDESAAPRTLRFGAGSVDVYNPRQQRELEANVFAMAFLLPPDELRARFLAGQSYRQIAAHFRVSPAAALNALATTLLDPSGAVEGEPASQAGGGDAVTEPDLDRSQLAAATVEAGPVLVNAGPGTGKAHACGAGGASAA